MATNTLRPNAGPPRGNVARPVAPPPPAPEEVPVVAPVPEAAPTPPPVPEARQPKPEPAAPRRKPVPEKPASTWSLFSLLDRFTGLDSFFQEGLPVQYLPHVLFVMLLTLIYIGNTHYGNRMNRNIQRLKLETEDLRADYTTLSSDYMEASKQSEVARKVAAIGLVESSSPPFRIVVPAGRLDGAELEAMPVLTADTLAARAARDSAASQRADSLLGRARRQAATTDSPEGELEAGPPPGPEEGDDTEGVELAKSAAPVVPREKKSSNKSLKKSKSVQKESVSNAGKAKRSKSVSSSKQTATHERKR